MSEPRGAVARLADAIAIIGFAGLTVMAMLTFYDGAARWLGAPRLSGFHDYPMVVYPVVIASCFPAVLLRQGNVTIRLFAGRLGAGGSRFLETFAAALTLLLLAGITWQLAEMALAYDAAGRVTNTVGIPLAPTWYLVAALFALATLVQASVAFDWARGRGAAPGEGAAP